MNRYKAADTRQAVAVLYMILVRLMHAAEVALIYMIDGEPKKGMKFLANNIGIQVVADYWKQCVDTFISDEDRPHVPLEK
jgi:hypothetical protein